MNAEQFFKKMSPYAIDAGAKLDMPAQVILAQWALESAYGTSSLAREANNYGGIKFTDHADGRHGAYSAYNSIQAFCNDYVRVLSLSYYDEVREAETVKETVAALDRSAYAEDTNYAEKINRILDTQNVLVKEEGHKYHKPSGGLVKRGDKGGIVKVIQDLCGAEQDGLFGPVTEAHVKAYQGKHGLTTDGIVGDVTWDSFTYGYGRYFYKGA